MGPHRSLTLHIFQVQEDGVLAHKVSQQFCHVGDAMWNDRQPLPAYHVTPGKALGEGTGYVNELILPMLWLQDTRI